MASPPSEAPATVSPRRIGAKWRVRTILASLLALALVVAAGLWYYRSSQVDAGARLAELIAKVRARGEPLTTSELNDYYQPAQNRPDLTTELMAALAICEAQESTPLAANLPLVGQGPEPPLPPQTWSQLEESEQYLSRVSTALATFRDVAERRGTARFPVDFTPGIATTQPQIQSIRLGSRVILLQFHVDLHCGQTSNAVACLLDQLALADALDQEPILTSQLVRLALVSVAIKNVQQILQCADLSDSEIVQIQQGLRNIEYTACLQRALAGDRAIAFSMCGDPQLSPANGTLTQPGSRQPLTRTPNRTTDAAEILELNLRITTGAEKSLYDAWQAGLGAAADVEGLTPGAWSGFSYSMAVLLSPAYRQALTAFARSAAKRNCADVALAAELYRHRHGAWPETIPELVPEFLPSAPLDPFTNQLLKLVTRADKLIVYSVGTDSVDNGGNISDGDEPGVDVGFFVPLRRDH
jgi:hypothetical protein